MQCRPTHTHTHVATRIECRGDQKLTGRWPDATAGPWRSGARSPILGDSAAVSQRESGDGKSANTAKVAAAIVVITITASCNFDALFHPHTRSPAHHNCITLPHHPSQPDINIRHFFLKCNFPVRLVMRFLLNWNGIALR